MMRTIRLYGVLRQRFGREYRLDVISPADAIQALCQMLPGFERFLATAEERGLVFAVFAGKRNLGEHDLNLQGADETDIRIAPIVAGSKRGGLFQVIVGVVLIVAGVFTGGTSSAAGLAMLGAGAGLAIGGVMQMLSPTQGQVRGREEEGNAASYGFGGAISTIAQGNPWPRLYGEREIGGAVGSAGIYAQDQV
ncbi:tail assembly protein [Pseudomonas tohonis]|uniref:tail assembly protein n=1 Tax=Pseudomonas tohonis TaxID=2725477 RepID=UPI0022F1325B|nr:tail assembly protein [Pseudomonas tohonis]